MLHALPPDPILEFAMRQWSHEPAMRVEDAYKWLFQATLGGEHAVSDMKMVRDWLDGEWATLGKPLPGERLTVPLTSDGLLVRLNLRPFEARGGTKQQVLAIFVRSAKEFKGDKQTFIREWHNLGITLQQTRLGQINVAAWTKLDREAAKAGYPAIDHSAAYEKAAKPAYRVVLRSLIPVTE